MLVVLAILTGGYLAAVVWIVRAKRRAGTAGQVGTGCAHLPADDQPPPAAVGWPPGGRQFLTYVDEGYRALDAYLSEGFTA